MSDSLWTSVAECLVIVSVLALGYAACWILDPWSYVSMIPPQ